MRPVVCIAGPTASGKSAFAVDLARSVGGEIVNADALQVYTDLQVLSARPLKSEQGGIPHHLFGHIPGETAYSTGQWLREAVPVILDVLARGRTPILVGGTGLYFRALLSGLADIPPVPKDVQARLDAAPVETLRTRAARVDPVAAERVLGDDPQRLSRIVGVHEATGRALSDWQARTRPVLPMRHARPCVILPPRERHYDRINRRFDLMMANGALEEAKAVLAQGFPSRSPMLKAIGLSHLLSYLDGECDLETAMGTAKRDTRRLAKRQSTWFRNQTPGWPMLCDAYAMDGFKHGLA